MFNIYHDLTIQCAFDELYTTISTPKGLNIWWTQEAEGVPGLGNIFRFYFGPDYDWRGEVVALGKDHISYKITKADDDWTDTQLNFKIINKNNDSHILRFEHINWKNLNDHFRQTSCCWAEYLLNLKSHLESDPGS